MAIFHCRVFLLVAVAFWVLPGAAQENETPEKMHERLHRFAIEAIAKAQVIETKCGLKGQITATISAMALRGVVVEDFAEIFYAAADIAKEASDTSAIEWCRFHAKPFRQTISKY
jgi:hypothetical protein